jgi:undecaprenyl diphosphate synthase
MFDKKKNPAALDMEHLPYHVGIIMDGNGRWAQKRMLPRVAGHRAAMVNVKKAIRFSSDIGIKVLTLYAFSTENWKRPKDEVSALMSILLEYLGKELEEMHKKEVVVRTIGDIAGLPQPVQDLLNRSVEKTRFNRGMILNLALNYGSRTEIIRAVRNIAQEVKEEKIKIEDINENLFANHLYTSSIPDPDLIIRTSGENRISNFLLYQMAYSELYFTPTLFPDFDEKEYAKALIEYQGRQRRFGAV